MLQHQTVVEQVAVRLLAGAGSDAGTVYFTADEQKLLKGLAGRAA
jgi:hypothetical protein